MTSAAQQVKKGAALLDKKRRGWALKVCVPELNMAWGTHCILGYVYGPDDRTESVYNADGEDGFTAGMKKLFPDDWNEADWGQDNKFGFDHRAGLRRLWIVEIGKRLAKTLTRRPGSRAA